MAAVTFDALRVAAAELTSNKMQLAAHLVDPSADNRAQLVHLASNLLQAEVVELEGLSPAINVDVPRFSLDELLNAMTGTVMLHTSYAGQGLVKEKLSTVEGAVETDKKRNATATSSNTRSVKEGVVPSRPCARPSQTPLPLRLRCRRCGVGAVHRCRAGAHWQSRGVVGKLFHHLSPPRPPPMRSTTPPESSSAQEEALMLRILRSPPFTSESFDQT